ncbi:MAG: type VI secretion system membrane subunit TssM [Nannocystaceae bacterium]|nr:type VI secretion system membrane subunit TssM [bacterium]
MLKYIFSALLIGAVWAVVLLLEFPMWIAIVATAVIIAILVTVILVKILRAKKAAREIEKALQAQAAAQSASARPDLKAEVDAMQAEFLKAVAALKTSKLGKSGGGKKGADALYALPWYMIIGPPGAGKSTALRNSGLRFPYSAGAVQGVGGTRNCQWWMTNEAVILDTAGRYTTEEADRDEWMGFLELLRKNRPKRPVNGVLVAIALTDLSDSGPDDVLARAREIRARVDEVMGKLQMVVPVYVLFTKCDLLPGFVEMFSDLQQKDRGQIWGFTVPVSTKDKPAPLFDDHFTELAEVVERRAMRRLAEERAESAKDKIFTFPQYFEPLKENLSMFVGELMAESIYTESPIFRGAYFTSGTQEGSPIDRIMNGMAEAFGVQPQMSFTQQQTEAKSYFLGDVFGKVIFPDKNVATRSASHVKRQAIVGHSIAAGLFLLAVGLAVLPVLSFKRNRDFLTRGEEAIAKLQEHKQSEHAGVDPIEIDKLQPLYAVERELDDHEADGVPVMMRMGMYQGGRFTDRVEALYVETVREEVVQPLVAIEVRELKRFAATYGPLSDQPKPEEQEEFRARLRTYLLLSGAYGEDEPGLDEEQRSWLADRLGTSWGAILERMNLTGDVATMKSVAEAYVDNLAEHPDRLLFERDTKLVKDVRKILKRTDQTQALLDELLRDIETQDLTLNAVTASKTALKNDNRTIRGAYTRTAWENEIRGNLEAVLATAQGNEWVLGRTEEEAKKSKENQLAALRSLYFENYIGEWKGFINAIYVVAPDDLLEAQKVFTDLTSGATPPLKRLCQNIDYHTTLLEEETASDGAMDAAKELGGKALEKGAKKNKKLGAAADAAKKFAPGGNDANPLLKTPDDVRKAFEGLSGFGYLPTPAVPEGQAAPPPPPVQLDRYQESLKSVRDALKKKIDHDDDEAAKGLSGAVRDGLTEIEAVLNESDLKGWRPTLARWLPPPFEAVQAMVGKEFKGTLAKNYCESVYKPMTAMLGRYPFAKNGRNVKFKDFEELLHPETGALWTYYGTALASRIPRKHGTFEFEKRGAKETIKYNRQVVKFLERADDLSRVMFPGGEMLVEFEVYIDDNPAAAITTLEIDGKKIEHKNGPGRFLPMQWPGEDEPGTQIKTRSKSVRGEVTRDGPWGFFEVLEEGTISGSTDSAVFVLKWDLRDQEAGVVKMKFRPAEDDTPFFGTQERPTEFLQIFRHPDLQPPANLILDTQGCKE